ncbi:hypothetical protein G6O69_33600 [Pseudenhygromyxa sp. WMMC2535]|uniref:hypothetical protein n=1 Tax=Pseudenhygromyxa sp. WMMC2535 TaxID=2712867 RepID=UPI001552EEDA|nr:hypothetical protein [Pseudenhygromyxa sp. WMMC2535]NVB42805.1 hypothetical protein [Pseudenhygromyxa sp. WMMC2535]
MLGSETLAATPDSLTYEGTRFSTELISAGLAGLAETASQSVRAGLGRTLSGCRGNCVRAGLEGIAAIGCFVPGTRVRTPEGAATIETRSQRYHYNDCRNIYPGILFAEHFRPNLVRNSFLTSPEH